MVRTFILACMMSLLPLAAGAEETIAASASAQTGPVIGAEAPAAEFTKSSGETIRLKSLAGSKGTVLVLFRSADWCPFCKKQLEDLASAAAPLGRSGWTLAAASYDAPETLAAFQAEKSLPYSLLSDKGSAAIRAFGLLNEEMKPDSRFYGVPHPAIIFIGADGKVKAVLREEGYRDRPAVETVLATAAGL